MSSTVDEMTTPVSPVQTEASIPPAESGDAPYGADEERLVLAARQAAVLRLARAM